MNLIEPYRLTRAGIEQDRIEAIENNDPVPQNDHAPVGYSILMQFFEGETREQAIARTIEYCEVTEDELAIAPGHYTCRDASNQTPAWSWRDHGWMVFVRNLT